METNFSVTRTPSFEGRTDWRTKKLAKKLDSFVGDALTDKAGAMHKNTILSLRDIDGQYILAAFNTKLGVRSRIDTVSKSKGIEALKKTIVKINPQEVDRNLIETDVKAIFGLANDAYSSSERKFLRSQSKNNLRVQRETGIYIPFWRLAKEKSNQCVERTNSYWAENTSSPYDLAEEIF